MTTNIDTQGAFKVGSWLTSVDNRSRENLLKCCEGWNFSHTDILLQEVEMLLRGESLLDIQLMRIDQKQLLYIATLFSKYREFPYTPAAVGLTIIG